mgnify:CR=1 FL=1
MYLYILIHAEGNHLDKRDNVPQSNGSGPYFALSDLKKKHIFFCDRNVKKTQFFFHAS